MITSIITYLNGKRKPALVLFFLLSVCYLGAQTKTEREYRVQQSKVPVKAAAFIDSCLFNKKVKWYAEESQKGLSYEAKTRFNKTLYSIEFDTTGKVEDVEWIVDFADLENSLQKKLENSIDQIFESYRFNKIQCQWTGREQSLLDLINNGQTGHPYTTRYEIVIKGRKGGNAGYFEVLTSDKGIVIEVMQIVQPETVNLEF